MCPVDAEKRYFLCLPPNVSSTSTNINFHIKHLDSFEGLMAIIIFTALARIDVCRHNIVSPFISNLSELLP